jgi:MFS family permease
MNPPESRRAFAVFLTDFVSYGVAMSAISMATYLPLLLRTYGASEITIGMVPAIFAAGRMTGLLAAPVLESLPLVRRWMVTAMFVERFSLILCGLWIMVGPATRPHVVVAGVLALWLVYTCTNGWASTAWGTSVARSLDRRRRGELTGLGSGLSALSGLAVVPIVGLAIAHFGLARGYGLAFTAAGLLLMGSCLVFLTVPEAPSAHVKIRVGLARYLKEMGPLLRQDRRYRWFLAAMALWLAGSTGSAYFTIYAMEHFGAGTGVVMGYTIAMSVGAGTAGLAAGRLSERLGFVRIFAAGIVLTMASMLVACVAPASGWMYAAFAITGAGGTVSWMAIINLPLELADGPNVPTYYAVASLVRGPAGAAAPIAAGLYLERFPYPPLFALCALSCLLAVLVLTRFVSDPQQEGD